MYIETYAYIEKDLRESILLLRKQRYQLSEAGQISAGGALGLLMKVLLYEASPGVDLPNVDKAAKWNEVVEIGKYFIEGQNISVNDLLKFDSRYTESWVVDAGWGYDHNPCPVEVREGVAYLANRTGCVAAVRENGEWLWTEKFASSAANDFLVDGRNRLWITFIEGKIFCLGDPVTR